MLEKLMNLRKSKLDTEELGGLNLHRGEVTAKCSQLRPRRSMKCIVPSEGFINKSKCGSVNSGGRPGGLTVPSFSSVARAMLQGFT